MCCRLSARGSEIPSHRAGRLKAVKLQNERWGSERLLKIDQIFSCFHQIYHRLKAPLIEDVDSSGFHYCVSHNLGSAAVHLNH